MPELIDRQSALRLCIEGDGHDDERFTEGYNFAVSEIREELQKLPTIEPEVQHGHWIFREEVTPEYLPWDMWCSCCGGYHDSDDYNDRYCSKCGAKMDEVLTMQNESWFTDDFNQCDNCPDWDNKKGCKSYGKGCEDGSADNWLI